MLSVHYSVQCKVCSTVWGTGGQTSEGVMGRGQEALSRRDGRNGGQRAGECRVRGGQACRHGPSYLVLRASHEAVGSFDFII